MRRTFIDDSAVQLHRDRATDNLTQETRWIPPFALRTVRVHGGVLAIYAVLGGFPRYVNLYVDS